MSDTSVDTKFNSRLCKIIANYVEKNLVIDQVNIFNGVIAYSGWTLDPNYLESLNGGSLHFSRDGSVLINCRLIVVSRSQRPCVDACVQPLSKSSVNVLIVSFCLTTSLCPSILVIEQFKDARIPKSICPA